MALLQSSLCRLSLTKTFLSLKTVPLNKIFTAAPLTKLSVEEKLGIKPRPKRPKSAFLRFLYEIKPKILEENPNASVTEINRIAGEKWRATDDKFKAGLSNQFKADWNKYLDELKAYDKMLSPIQKEEIQKANETISVNKKKKKMKQKMVQLGKPKRPPSTFVSFMQSKAQERGEMPFKDWQKQVSKEWDSAPSNLKEELNKKYVKEMDKYKSDLQKWEQKMKKEGHQELVRRAHS